MNILKLLGFHRKKSTNSEYLYKDILHLWEDDNLMLELLPNENLEFVKSETRRINDFGEEHSDGFGYSEITGIGEKPVKTIEKLIDVSEIESILIAVGFEKINQFIMEGVGLLEGDRAPLGYGTNKFAILCEKRNQLLENIWITGQTRSQEDKQRLIAALLLLGQTFNFIGVNWYKGEYYDLVEKKSVEEFVNISC